MKESYFAARPWTEPEALPRSDMGSYVTSLDDLVRLARFHCFARGPEPSSSFIAINDK